MQPFTMKKKLISLTLVSLLAACGGGGGGGGDDLIIGSGSGGSSGGTDGGTDGGTATPTESLSLGTGTGASFNPRTMSLASSSISAQGQTTVSVNVVDLASDSALATSSVTVSFTSTCVESGNASITSSVTVEDGLAQAVYTDIDCASSDIITASLPSGATATASLDVASLTLGAISFVSADPTTIALANLSGGTLQTYSTIVFQVVDESGNPISGQDVTFDVPLLESMGGASFTPATDTSDGNGLVSTTFSSGTVKTTASVVASVDGSLLSTSSSTISISTGIAIQKSISLSFSEHNPLAWNYDGVETEVTVRLSDFYQNPVPDGGKVSFKASHGQIDPDCTLSNNTGSCTVNWRSQSPRPANGRVAIMAFIKGEETQTLDANGNGLYDSDIDTFQRLSEAFVDTNENGICDFGEDFTDSNNNGSCDTDATTKYKGVRCADSDDCAGLTDVFINGHIVMASNDLTVSLVGGSTITPSPTQISFTVSDENGNVPAVGTTITASFTPALNDEDALDASTFTVASTNGNAIPYSVIMTGDGNASTGLLKITTTSTDGIFQDTFFNITE